MAAASSFYDDRPLVIAHRGASDVAPENTLAAFQAAIDASADGIELDVTRCATGEIVVIHDDTLDRTTNGAGRVDGLPFFGLRELDAGAWFGAQFAGQRIPTLGEVLDLAGRRVRVNIEIKGRNVRGDGLEEEVAEQVRARGLQGSVILSSFNPAALVRAKRAASDLQRALLYAPDLPVYLAHAWALPLVRPEALHPKYTMVDSRYVHWAHGHGYRVNVWTVDDPDHMARMIELGVDGIITNHPARLRELLPL
jgi:glycerophosphoryl diester phosphodiesterase